MRRRIILVTGIVLACAVIALAALPWWLGAALKAGGGSFGLTFGEYRRMGYTRFVLTDVTVRRPGVEVTTSRIELGTPLVWLVGNPGAVTIERWSVVVGPTDGPTDESRPRGWRPLRARLDRIIAGLQRRLPPTTAEAGEIAWPGGTLHLAGAKWDADDARALTITGLSRDEQRADVSVEVDETNGRLIIEARETGGLWEARVESAGAELSGRGSWRDQPVGGGARFGETGWMPMEANVTATDWSLAATNVGLGEFYATIAGHANVAWRDGVLTVEAQAEGEPLEGNEAPPLAVRLHGEGGLDRLSIDRLDIRMPGIEGHLSEPITVGRKGRLLSGASRFDLTMDLAKQPWFAGRGRVTGAVVITPREEGVPLVSATLTSVDAAVADWIATKTEVAAKIEWPTLRVEVATVKLADGDELALGGEWNARTRTLSQGWIRGRASRETVARWLTAEMEFETLEIDATAEGTWPLLAHKGRAQATGLRVSPLRPLALDAEWNGTGRTLDSVAVDVRAGETRLKARGSVGADAARIEELVLAQTTTERLRLAAPANVRWSPSILVDEFRLDGPRGEVAARLAWGETGGVKLNVKTFESRWLADLLDPPGPDWSVSSLALQGGWDGGPLAFTVNGEGQVELDEGRRAELALAASGDADGVRVEKVSVSMDQRHVARANGRLPVTIHPGQTPLLRIDEDEALLVDAATEPNAFFWKQFTAATGLVLIDPEVKVKLTGTVEKPIGEATMSIGKVAPDGSGRLHTWPEVEALKARMTGDRAGVSLETFTLKIAGQEVRASGRLPIKQWTKLADDPFGLVKADGEARIEIPDAEVAALARYAPEYLAPAGTLQVDVALHKGGQFSGVVRLKDAATRPLGPLGTLQAIGAEIVLAGRTIEFKDVRANAGGQPVTLSGTATLADGKAPRLDLALRGANLPFVRQAGLLVRGDLDLRIVTDDAETTRITGATRLRDSFFLMDVRALLPTGGGRSAPGRRPPYFTVDVPPFDDWGLDVTVDGDRFLRMRTPVFTGLASAHFRLRGTLGDPRATGEAVVNEGRVLLPFATFVVQQGDVRITETNPFEPRVSVVATSRRYGYDLRMEVTGTVNKPRVTFFSTPPLESEQVLLMVMAGETPQNEITYSSRERAARLGAYLGQSLLKQLGGDPEATERLTVTVGERISRQGRETYGVEYELNPRWSLVGEYDEFDEYNVGVKWHVLSEKSQEDTDDERK